MTGRSVANRSRNFDLRGDSHVAWQRAVPFAELTDGVAHRVDIEGQPIMIARLGDEVHAVRDVCPHRGAALSEGLLRDGCITCPAHLWRFSLRDGTKQGDPQTRITCYPVRLAQLWVEIDVSPMPPARSLRETLLAHARGESVNGGDRG